MVGMLARVTLLLQFSILALGTRTIYEEIRRLYQQQSLPYREHWFFDNQPILDEYDFIVVGSGPAGAAVASKLTDVLQWNILVIEAGPEENIYNDIPSLNAASVLTNFSQIYEVEKEPNVCTGLVEGRCIWPNGRAVGGASVINGMLYTRGHPQDFDRWAADGNPGWSYSELLPYFLRVENMSLDGLAQSEFHSTSGSVHLEYPYPSKLQHRFLKAGQEFGYNLVDYNNPYTMLGFSTSQITTKKGRRHSAASAYLMPIRYRPNFHIVKNSLVTQILIHPTSNRAYGVKFLKKNKERIVLAKNEVIVSAGAFNTPQLLMLSGVGPEKHLEEMKIPVIQNLPVGNNLQEHLGTPSLIYKINTTDSWTALKFAGNSPYYLYKWMKDGKSEFANNGAEALGYIKTPLANEEKADIELIFIPITIASDGGIILRKTMGISDKTYYKTWSKLSFVEGFSIFPMGMYPKSRGTVRLRSKDPKDAVVIDGNFFTDKYDVKVLIEGIKQAIELTKMPSFQKVGAELYRTPVAGCEKTEFGSDDYWECALRRVPLQFHHQCGTARMGPDPASSVVDPRLRVHGVAGLRVVDASIIPHITGAHTMAPAYMIGEKAADLIKEDWDLRTILS